MPLFELDGGQLVPAQFGRTVNEGISADILASVRDQVLEIIGRPLFPITWEEDAAGGQPKLTALDPSGQVVSVEVLPLLDSSTMIESLSRLAETANMGWNELANAYPGGIHNFRFGWAEFRNLMPPSPAPGPRLILVVAEIVPAVRPVLDVLATSGVEVHELSLREMRNGRRFVEVQAVGPRLYGHNPNLLLQSGGHLALPGHEGLKATEEIVATVEETEALKADELTKPEAEPKYAIYEPDTLLEETAPQEKEATPEKQAAPEEELSVPDFLRSDSAGRAPKRRPSNLPKRADRHTGQRSQVLKLSSEARESTEAETTAATEYLEPDQMGLYTIAQIVGTEIELVWSFSDVERFYAKLSPEGVIYTDKWSTTDPTEAVRLIGSVVPFDGWEVWRLGSVSGPTLKEALDEINAEIKTTTQSSKPSQERRVGTRANRIRVERNQANQPSRNGGRTEGKPMLRHRRSPRRF
ncbi:hypothetical protein NXS08_04150 [Gleimia sp. 6138-11-ORH1]|uniref:hypothetical protein n=1 Tax=Gleimia sp. 6138-11-ORH1 TaxID=2973937 RepID=UPI00216A068E|nr:hypothetical protein [Gleimia sp. 6138-11-ORH1]MCS4484678.1 hypothetical protein [Gleimia sp. 6138-11-ORH1]